jgi:hypothetical protein
MEPSNSERYDDEKEHRFELVIEGLATFVYYGDITDDNPSPTNKMTSLEQIIQFELDEYLGGKITIEYIKACIRKEIGETEYSDFDDIDFDEDDIKDIDLPITAEKFINQPKIAQDIKRIAEFIFFNIVTEDNPSEESGENTLEQLIPFCFSKYIFYSEKYYKEIVKGINSHLNTVNGGANIFFGKQDSNILNQDDFPIIDL